MRLNQKGKKPCSILVEQIKGEEDSNLAEAMLQINQGLDKAVIAWVLFLLCDTTKGKTA